MSRLLEMMEPQTPQKKNGEVVSKDAGVVTKTASSGEFKIGPIVILGLDLKGVQSLVTTNETGHTPASPGFRSECTCAAQSCFCAPKSMRCPPKPKPTK